MEHEDASLPHGHIALLKTQDLGYVKMKRAVDLKVRLVCCVCVIRVLVERNVHGSASQQEPKIALSSGHTRTHTLLQSNRRTTGQKAEKLQSGLHFLMDRPPNKHTVFVDSEKDAEVRGWVCGSMDVCV